MRKIPTLILLFSTMFAVHAANATTCPAFDTVTGNTATSPNPLDIVFQKFNVCNIPQTQIFTDELGTYTLSNSSGGCYMKCSAGQVMVDGVCITSPGWTGLSGLLFAEQEEFPGLNIPNCPSYNEHPGHDVFFSLDMDYILPSIPGYSGMSACSSVFGCEWGDTFISSCDRNSHWNPAIGRCQNIEDVKCPITFTRPCFMWNATSAVTTCFQGASPEHCGPCRATRCAAGYFLKQPTVSGGVATCSQCPEGQFLSTTGSCRANCPSGQELSTTEVCFTNIQQWPRACGGPDSPGPQPPANAHGWHMACNGGTGVNALCIPCQWHCDEGFVKSGNSCVSTGPCDITNGIGRVFANRSGLLGCAVVSCNAGYFARYESADNDGFGACHPRETWQTNCPNPEHVRACNAAGTICDECKLPNCGPGQNRATTGECFSGGSASGCSAPAGYTGMILYSDNSSLQTHCFYIGL
ncbi:MAG: hypothetical protein FWE52_01695 [Alphaproteobacteria bacterium]|nr:hypothetical protein [Alphaproteobacteria bacterium]